MDAYLQKEIPAMILQPLYENAIKHGVYESTGVVTIQTNCVFNNNVMEVVIKNDYDPTSVQRKGEGIGLKNVKNRMKLIFGRTDLVEIKKEESTFEVKLVFPEIH